MPPPTMKIKKRHVTVAIAVLAGSAFAGEESSGHGLDPTVLVGISIILICASLFGEAFEKLKQPAVLGELLAGIILGNLVFIGFPYAEPLKTDLVIEALAQFGVILLLFEVGLETNLSELLKVGGSSLLVALIGIVAPFGLGWLAAYIFVPEGPTLSHIFIGAMLTATSIGITARVLRDLGHISTREARIVLGAAVIDDVLGLLLLGIVDSAIEASQSGEDVALAFYAYVTVKAVGFLVIATILGHFLIPRFFKSVRRFESKSLVIGLSIAICFLGAYVASMVGLAAIIGAFAAGVVLDEVHFEHFLDHEKHHLEDFLTPVSALVAPIFFIYVGLKVDLSAFGNLSLLGFAAAITVAAITGKLLCTFGARGEKLNKLAIGFGMVPRGEVVLFFASVGTTLMVANAAGATVPVISNEAYSSVVIMVIVTTMMTPPLLKWALDSDLDRSEIENKVLRLPHEK